MGGQRQGTSCRLRPMEACWPAGVHQGEAAMFDKIKCATGFHDWSSWRNPDACEQYRVCLRSHCPKRETQTVHAWTNYSYVADNSCEQTRKCTRCPATEKRVADHQWSAWSYGAQDDCNQTRSCARCSAHESQVLHQWDAWKYAAPTTCDQVRFCRRCTTGKQLRVATDSDHRWGSNTRVDCTHALRECAHCGRSKQELFAINSFKAMHVFGAQYRNSIGAQEVQCRECGFKQLSR
jgi:hypothetical protein